MGYQKTQWKDHIEGVQVGTPVNAANMNKIEEGIAAVSNVIDYSTQVVAMNGFTPNLIVQKIGHLVIVKNYIDKSSGTYSTSGARVATLPAAVAPSRILYFASTAYNFDGGEYAAHVTISANGAVITYAPASATIAIIDAVYFV